MTHMHGTGTFAPGLPNTTEIVVDDIPASRLEPFSVLSVSKRAAGRKKDLAVIPALEEALAATEEIARTPFAELPSRADLTLSKSNPRSSPLRKPKRWPKARPPLSCLLPVPRSLRSAGKLCQLGVRFAPSTRPARALARGRRSKMRPNFSWAQPTFSGPWRRSRACYAKRGSPTLDRSDGPSTSTATSA